jgi:hypothetical protein
VVVVPVPFPDDALRHDFELFDQFVVIRRAMKRDEA